MPLHRLGGFYRYRGFEALSKNADSERAFNQNLWSKLRVQIYENLLLLKMESAMKSNGGQSSGLSPILAAALATGAVTTALLIGKRSGPTPDHPQTALWYQHLEKPDFTPPSPVYPIAWTSIQTALAYGGYRLMRANSSPQRTTALAIWLANQVGIGGWSEIFFGRRSPGLGTVASAALGVGAVGYVVAAEKVDSTAAKLGVPLVAWVAFATLLSEEIWRRNDD